MNVKSFVPLIFAVAVAGGVYYAYDQGVISFDLGSWKQVNVSLPAIGESQEGQVVEEGEAEVSENNVKFGIGDEYITYPLLYPSPRWNHMPLTYYVKTDTGWGLTGFDNEDANYVRQAVEVWEEKTGGIVSFAEVSDIGKADVTFSWFASLTDIPEGRVVGEGGPSRAIPTGGPHTLIEKGEVFLLPTENDCVGINRPVHEIGHVLGLGHAPPGHGDIMFSKEISCKQNITEVTAGAIAQLYKNPAQPDLILSNVSAVKSGGYLSLNFTVKNIGIVESTQSYMSFMGDGEKVESLSIPKFSVISSVSPGTGLTVRITNAKVDSKMADLVLTIDSGAAVAESREDNNVARVSFS